MQVQNQFDATNSNFIARVVIVFLGLIAAAGVQLPKAPEDLAGEIVNTFSGGGYFAVVSILAISVIMPIWNYVKGREYPTLREFFSKINTWTYIVFFALSLIALIGIPVLFTNTGDIALAIYTKDWAAVVGLIFTAVLEPLFRWLVDRRMQVKQESV